MCLYCLNGGTSRDTRSPSSFLLMSFRYHKIAVAIVFECWTGQWNDRHWFVNIACVHDVCLRSDASQIGTNAVFVASKCTILPRSNWCTLHILNFEDIMWVDVFVWLCENQICPRILSMPFTICLLGFDVDRHISRLCKQFVAFFLQSIADISNCENTCAQKTSALLFN